MKCLFMLANIKRNLDFQMRTKHTVSLTETVNTAIETVVDRISLDTHDLSKRAKDLGSLSVTFALIICLITWLYLIFG